MASQWNQHCANCIGALSFPIPNLQLADRRDVTKQFFFAFGRAERIELDIKARSYPATLSSVKFNCAAVTL